MRKILLLITTITLSLFTVGCTPSENVIDQAQETAYDLGYEKGYEFGYAAGYYDSLTGENMNVYSEIDGEVSDSIVTFVVNSDKIYHCDECPDTVGAQLGFFLSENDAEAAGFDACESCY